MDVIGIDRVILATHEMDEMAAQFKDLLGLSFGRQLEPSTNVQSGNLDVTNRISPSGFELVTPRSDGGELNRFLESNGPGLYAVSFRVTDLEVAVSDLAEKGLEPVGEYRKNDFDEVFYHPKHFGGAMVILAEYDAPHPAETASV